MGTSVSFLDTLQCAHDLFVQIHCQSKDVACMLQMTARGKSVAGCSLSKDANSLTAFDSPNFPELAVVGTEAEISRLLASCRKCQLPSVPYATTPQQSTCFVAATLARRTLSLQVKIHHRLLCKPPKGRFRVPAWNARVSLALPVVLGIGCRDLVSLLPLCGWWQVHLMTVTEVIVVCVVPGPCTVDFSRATRCWRKVAGQQSVKSPTPVGDCNATRGFKRRDLCKVADDVRKPLNLNFPKAVGSHTATLSRFELRRRCSRGFSDGFFVACLNKYDSRTIGFNNL